MDIIIFGARTAISETAKSLFLTGHRSSSDGVNERGSDNFQR